MLTAHLSEKMNWSTYEPQRLYKKRVCVVLAKTIEVVIKQTDIKLEALFLFSMPDRRPQHNVTVKNPSRFKKSIIE